MDASWGEQASSASASAVAGARQVLADYFELTKPKVQTLLLFTTITTMEIAGNPPVSLIALTCLGGYLSAGGAGAVNHYYDRDIDAQMKRTASRPIPSGRVSPRAALVFGFTLCALSFLLLSLTVNLLAAALALGGFLGYVGVYTIWLKRRSPQNIVIGGAAGAMPPVLGWCAVTGHVSFDALLLFLIIFAWTPPHFWSLALYRRDEYARAGVPMLPVTHGERYTLLNILIYAIILAAICLLPFASGMSGWIYLSCAVVLNGVFLAYAVRLYVSYRDRLARRMFRYSITYLFLLFAALLADHYWRLG